MQIKTLKIAELASWVLRHPAQWRERKSSGLLTTWKQPTLQYQHLDSRGTIPITTCMCTPIVATYHCKGIQLLWQFLRLKTLRQGRIWRNFNKNSEDSTASFWEELIIPMKGKVRQERRYFRERRTVLTEYYSPFIQVSPLGLVDAPGRTVSSSVMACSWLLGRFWETQKAFGWPNAIDVVDVVKVVVVVVV